MFKKIVKNFGPEWGAAVMGTAAICITLSIAVGIFFVANAKAETVKAKDWPYSFSKGGFQIYESEDKNERLTLGGSVLFRNAYWNWFELENMGSSDNEYDYAFLRTRLNLKFTSDDMDIFLQPQYVHMIGVPSDAWGEGPHGMGGLYYLHSDDKSPYDVGFHQAYIKFRNIFDQPFFFKFGRFEYSDGLEVLRASDGKKFNTLKNMRLADRLISPFGWSAFARSFDGFMGGYDGPKFNVTGSFFYPTQGGWEDNIDESIEDIKISTVTLTAKRGTLLPNTEFAGFYYNYKDDRDVTQRIDNMGASTEKPDIDIHTIGGHVLGLYDVGSGRQLDTLLWTAFQTGDWYELDHQAYAISAEIGYQFKDVYAKPWFRAGYFIGSGDSTPSDGEHETFFQMAPGTRKYNLVPFCDLMNTKDLFFQLITQPAKKTTVRIDYHILELTESEDRWYMGSGPTQEEGKIFGYLGRDSHGEDDLGQELDLIATYEFNPQLKLIGSYSHVFGGDVVEKFYGKGDDLDYFSIELQYKF